MVDWINTQQAQNGGDGGGGMMQVYFSLILEVKEAGERSVCVVGGIWDGVSYICFINNRRTVCRDEGRGWKELTKQMSWTCFIKWERVEKGRGERERETKNEKI